MDSIHWSSVPFFLGSCLIDVTHFYPAFVQFTWIWFKTIIMGLKSARMKFKSHYACLNEDWMLLKLVFAHRFDVQP
jgi:uncharacterized membrane protein